MMIFSSCTAEDHHSCSYTTEITFFKINYTKMPFFLLPF